MVFISSFIEQLSVSYQVHYLKLLYPCTDRLINRRNWMNLISQTSDSKSLVLNQCQFTYLIKYKEKLTHGTSIYCFTNASGMINLWNCLLKSDVLFYETNNVSLYPPPFYISGRTRFPLVTVYCYLYIENRFQNNQYSKVYFMSTSLSK